MTTDKATDVTVTQADIDLAVRIANLCGVELDDSPDTMPSQWIAGHRTASEQPASGEVMDVRPEIGASTPEPSLREIVRAYYEQEFNTQRAGELTVAYFAALSPPCEGAE